jgi:hypothetical protein
MVPSKASARERGRVVHQDGREHRCGKGKRRASDVVKPDQFASVLRSGSASAAETGTIQLSEAALFEIRP